MRFNRSPRSVKSTVFGLGFRQLGIRHEDEVEVEVWRAQNHLAVCKSHRMFELYIIKNSALKI